MSDKYLERGVSAKKEEVHLAIQNLSKGEYDGLFCKVFPDILAGNPDYLNLMSSDGSGTKSILAYLYWKETGDATVFRGIGQDALVMNLDDMMAIGCEGPFLFTSLINRNKHRIPGEIIKEIISGTEEYIQKMAQYGLEICYTGGETADVGDLVRTISVDASLTARMHRKDLIYTNSIAPDMLIVGISSYGNISYEKNYNSGIGSNGLTSARHDLLSKYYANKYPESIEKMVNPEVQYIGKNRLTDNVSETQTLGQWLLSPTISYAPLLKQVFGLGRKNINSIIHCTGGAAGKVLHFVENVGIIKDNWIKIPPLFTKIQSETNTSWEEMFGVMNMGIRLEIYLKEKSIAQEIIQMAKSFGFEADIIGKTIAADKAYVEIIHQNKSIFIKK